MHDITATASAPRRRNTPVSPSSVAGAVARRATVSEMFVGILGHDPAQPAERGAGGAPRSSRRHLLTREGRRVGRSDRLQRRRAWPDDESSSSSTSRTGPARGGHLPRPCAPLDLAQLAREIVECRAAGPSRRCASPRWARPAARGTVDRVFQVLSNLVGTRAPAQVRSAARSFRSRFDGTDPALVSLGGVQPGRDPAGPAAGALRRHFAGRSDRAAASAAFSRGLGLGLYVARQICAGPRQERARPVAVVDAAARPAELRLPQSVAVVSVATVEGLARDEVQAAASSGSRCRAHLPRGDGADVRHPTAAARAIAPAEHAKS